MEIFIPKYYEAEAWVAQNEKLTFQVMNTYRIVASRSTTYYSGNQKFCFLESRLLTCTNIFF
jgi:hypothetical protein